MIFLLLGTALAQDIPAKPEPHPAVENQCVEATPLTEPCSAVAIPTSKAADMLDIEIWGDQLHSHYQTDFQAWQLQQDSLLRENKKLKRTIWIRAAEAVVIGFAAGYITYHTVQETR
jgi:hypothetical protein